MGWGGKAFVEEPWGMSRGFVRLASVPVIGCRKSVKEHHAGYTDSLASGGCPKPPVALAQRVDYIDAGKVAKQKMPDLMNSWQISGGRDRFRVA